MTAARKYLMILIALAAVLAVVGCTREITRVEYVEGGPQSCFGCHSDQDPFLVAMTFAWENSWHASGRVVARSTSAGCAQCHSTDGFIQYAAGEEVTGADNPTVIHCFACHQPHTNGNFGLRKDDPQEVMDGTVYDIGAGNLCVNCHHARRNVGDYVTDSNKLSTHWGPHHGPQADMLFGANGYKFDGYEYGDNSWHRNQTDDGCVDCHFKFSNTYAVGGHSFNLRVVDEEGEEILNLDACNFCHRTLKDYNYHMVQTDVDSMVGVLGDMLYAAGVVDEEFEPTSVTVSADTAGALWNFLMAEEDRSRGVHNSDFIKSLLDSSIKYLNGDL